jgi:hypothetical protein
MSDFFSSVLIFTIIKTILSTFFFTVSKYYKKKNYFPNVTAENHPPTKRN